MPGRTADIGETLNDLGNSTPSRGEPRWQQQQRLVGMGAGGVSGESEDLKVRILLARRPRPLGWPNIGRWRRRRPTVLRERGHGTVEICCMADMWAEVDVDVEWCDSGGGPSCPRDSRPRCAGGIWKRGWRRVGGWISRWRTASWTRSWRARSKDMWHSHQYFMWSYTYTVLHLLSSSPIVNL